VESFLKIRNMKYNRDNSKYMMDIHRIKHNGTIYLTELGFHKAVFQSTCPLAVSIQRYYSGVLKRLRTTGSVTLEQAADDFKNLMNADAGTSNEVEVYKNKMAYYGEIIDTDISELYERLRCTNTQLIEYKNLAEDYMNKYEKLIINQLEITNISPTVSSVDKVFEHCYRLQKQYMKPLTIYTEHVLKKTLSGKFKNRNVSVLEREKMINHLMKCTSLENKREYFRKDSYAFDHKHYNETLLTYCQKEVETRISMFKTDNDQLGSYHDSDYEDEDSDSDEDNNDADNDMYNLNDTYVEKFNQMVDQMEEYTLIYYSIGYPEEDEKKNRVKKRQQLPLQYPIYVDMDKLKSLNINNKKGTKIIIESLTNRLIDKGMQHCEYKDKNGKRVVFRGTLGDLRTAIDELMDGLSKIPFIEVTDLLNKCSI